MTPNDEMVREYPPLGKLRVRLIEKADRKPALDVREWISNETFEGFTRRGIRLTCRQEAERLRATLTEIVEQKLLADE